MPAMRYSRETAAADIAGSILRCTRWQQDKAQQSATCRPIPRSLALVVHISGRRGLWRPRTAKRRILATPTPAAQPPSGHRAPCSQAPFAAKTLSWTLAVARVGSRAHAKSNRARKRRPCTLVTRRRVGQEVRIRRACSEAPAYAALCGRIPRALCPSAAHGASARSAARQSVGQPFVYPTHTTEGGPR